MDDTDDVNGRSWEERSTIYQAAGMIAVRRDGIEDAFELLRHRAASEQVDLYEYATRVVTREVKAADVAAGA